MIIRNDRLVSKHGLHSQSKFLPVRKWFVTPVNDGKTFSVTKRFPARERDWAPPRRGSTGGHGQGAGPRGWRIRTHQCEGVGLGPVDFTGVLLRQAGGDDTVGEQVPRVEEF